MRGVLLISLLFFSKFSLAKAELPCDGFFSNRTAFHAFEIHKDLTCINRIGFKPYHYEESKCNLSYDETKNSWSINSREIRFSPNCSEMSFLKWVFKAELSLPEYPSAPFPVAVDQMPDSSLPKNFSKLRNSIVKLGYGCTGTWLSNDGYFLTAIHCLIPELEYNGIGKVVSENEAIASRARIGYRGFQTTNFRSIRLDPIPNSQSGLSIEGVKDNSPRLVAIGPGGLSHRPIPVSQGEWNITQDQLARAQALTFEYVILKYDVNYTQTSCANIKTEPTNEEESLWSFGFKKIFNHATNEFERIFVVAAGKSYDKITSVKMAAPYLSLSERDYGIMNSPDLLFSDARTSPGMSGGPVFDAQGKIVGITSFGVEKYFKNIAEQAGFVRVSAMYRDLESKLSPAELKNIFKCF